MNTESVYINLLRRELERRSETNTRYSLRAFAKALKFEPSVISQILRGKRIPSYKTAQKLIQNMGLDPLTARDFMESLAETQKTRGLDRAFAPAPSTAEAPKMQDFGIDHFRVIADWYHIAILELTLVEGFQSDAKWIAKQLGLTPLEAKLAVDRLLRLGLLIKSRGRWTRTHERLSTTDKHMTTAALRKYQAQLLEKAAQSLENDPLEIRSMIGMTMTADPRVMPQAKKLVEECAKKISRLMQSGRKSQVYQLQISLYPLQKAGKEVLK